VLFAAGQTLSTFSVTLVDDNLQESLASDSLVLRLGTPNGPATLGSVNPHTLTIQDNDSNILIATHPASQFLRTGDTLSLAVVATGSGVLRYQWKKDGKVIVGATASTYTLPSASLTTAPGKYTVDVTNNTGTRPSNTAEVFVVDSTPRSLVAAQGANVTLSASAKGPAPMTFQWRARGNTRVLGTNPTLTLGVSGFAEYECEVAKAGTPALRAFSGITTVSPAAVPPTFAAITTLPVGMVGSPYRHQMDMVVNPTSTNRAQSFTAVGLPTGLKIDANGVISGSTTAVTTAKVITITAKNSASIATNPVTVAPTLTILPVPPGVVGNYIAVAERSPSVGSNHGARVTIDTTPVGGYTAKVTVEGVTSSVTGKLNATFAAGPSVASVFGSSDFLRKGKSTLRLAFTLDLASNQITNATLTDLSTARSVAVTGYRNRWSRTAPATQFAGDYTFALQIPAASDGDIDIPQGEGVGSFTVAADGKTTVSGVTADGMGYTSAGYAGPNGEMAVYSYLATPGGSIQGIADITEVAPTFANNTFTGTLSWNRAPEPSTSKAQTYRAGFDPIDLSIIGGKYRAPLTGEVVAGLSTTGVNNAKLSFLSGGLETGQVNDFTFSIAATTQRVTLPTVNANKVAFKLEAKPKGLYTGQFTIFNPITTLNRTAKFRGIIVWTGSVYVSNGHFLLAQPPQSGQTVSTSTVLSGQVNLVRP
jgi:hypothetical protein